MVWRKFTCACMAVLLGVMFFVPGAPRAEESDKPARGFVAALAYPGITVGTEDKVRVDLIVRNTGRSDETVYLEVTAKPEGWSADIKSYTNVVTGVFVAKDEQKTLTLAAAPETDDEAMTLPVGAYRFEIKARTGDNMLVMTTAVDVTVVEKEKGEEGIKLETSYPVLRGPSDSSFEFTLDMENESDEDQLFNLRGDAPDGWEVSFKPAYEQKQISSMQIKANQNRSVGVEVVPPRGAEAGEYPVKVRVQTPTAKAEVELTVVLTGTYEIKCGTLDGLLSLSAMRGKEASISIYVRNEGSAEQKEINFLTFKPENWKVEFDPEKVENLGAGEVKQVEMKIISNEESLVGDYSVGFSAHGEKASSEVELRVSVRASSAWGFIGVGIIVLVIMGLAFIFMRFGRR